jgi:hypothetical protein
MLIGIYQPERYNNILPINRYRLVCKTHDCSAAAMPLRSRPISSGKSTENVCSGVRYNSATESLYISTTIAQSTGLFEDETAGV